MKQIVRREIGMIRIDALANMVRARSTLSLVVWTALFVLACGSCVYLVLGACLQFASHKLTTTVRHLSELSAPLPTITFCNLNPFTSAFALELKSQANVSEPDVDEPTDFFSQYMQIQDYLQRTRNYTLTDDEKLRLAAFNYSILEWNTAALTRIFHPKYFGCLRLNANGTNVTLNAGNFFLAELYYGGDRPEVNMQLNPVDMAGFYVFVQNASDYPLGNERAPLLVSAGLSVSVAVERRFYRQYPHPFSECGVREDNTLAIELEDAYVFEHVVRTGYAYTQSTCVDFCTQEAIVDQCACNSHRIGYQVNKVYYVVIRLLHIIFEFFRIILNIRIFKLQLFPLEIKKKF